MQVYKALRQGVQPVAVKKITQADDWQMGQFIKVSSAAAILCIHLLCTLHSIIIITHQQAPAAYTPNRTDTKSHSCASWHDDQLDAESLLSMTKPQKAVHLCSMPRMQVLKSMLLAAGTQPDGEAFL